MEIIFQEATFDEEWCDSLLRDLYKTCPATNMPLENLLAKIKQSVPHSRQKVQAEKLMFAGHLSQLMQDHLDAHSVDPRSVLRSRAVLHKHGVPLRCSNKRHNARKRKNRVSNRKSKDSGKRTKRMKWINARTASAGDRDDAFREAARAWRQRRHDDVDDDDVSDPDTGEVLQKERFDFSGEWPIDDELLERFFTGEGHPNRNILI